MNSKKHTVHDSLLEVYVGFLWGKERSPPVSAQPRSFPAMPLHPNYLLGGLLGMQPIHEGAGGGGGGTMKDPLTFATWVQAMVPHKQQVTDRVYDNAETCSM